MKRYQKAPLDKKEIAILTGLALVGVFCVAVYSIGLITIIGWIF
jgi:hypothetical protein